MEDYVFNSTTTLGNGLPLVNHALASPDMEQNVWDGVDNNHLDFEPYFNFTELGLQYGSDGARETLVRDFVPLSQTDQSSRVSESDAQVDFLCDHELEFPNLFGDFFEDISYGNVPRPHTPTESEAIWYESRSGGDLQGTNAPSNWSDDTSSNVHDPAAMRHELQNAMTSLVSNGHPSNRTIRVDAESLDDLADGCFTGAPMNERSHDFGTEDGFTPRQSCRPSSSVLDKGRNGQSTRKVIPQKRHKEADWERIKPYFVALYIEDDMTLDEVARQLLRDHDFHATKAMYKKRITKWELSKNLTTARKLETLQIVEASATLQSNTSESMSYAAVEDKLRKLVRYHNDQIRNGRLRESKPQRFNFRIHKACQGSLAEFLQLCVPEVSLGSEASPEGCSHPDDCCISTEYLLQILQFNEEHLHSKSESNDQASPHETTLELHPTFKHVNIDRNAEIIFEVCDTLMQNLKSPSQRFFDEDVEQLDRKLEAASIAFGMHTHDQGAILLAEACDMLLESLTSSPTIILCVLPYLTSDRWQACPKARACLIALLRQTVKAGSSISSALETISPETDLRSPLQRLLWNRLHRFCTSQQTISPYLRRYIVRNQLRSHQAASSMPEVQQDDEDIQVEAEIHHRMSKAREQVTDHEMITD